MWGGGTDWYDLGGTEGAITVDGNLSHGYAASGDGSTVVGLCWSSTPGQAHACRWDAASGMVDLGSVYGRSSRANAISADGSTIVGWDAHTTGYWMGAVWQNGKERLLGAEGFVGEARAVNSNGTIIVGTGYPNSDGHAYRWSAAAGFTDLGILPGFNARAYAHALSEDGSVIVGHSGFGGDRDAFLWTEQLGMVNLNTYLRERGVDLTDWRLMTATAGSADGPPLGGGGGDGRQIEGPGVFPGG